MHKYSLLIICLACLLSCAPDATTKITATWKDPEAGRYKDFFVAVLVKNLQARKTLEADISSRLKKEGAKVVPSLDVFPHSETPDTPEERAAAVEKIQSLGHDAIITVTLLSKSEESRYVPGSTQYAPANMGYGTGYNNRQYGGAPGAGTPGAFGTYYMSGTTVASSPGYYEDFKTYFIETRLFDAKTAKLVWSVQSETFDPPNIATASSQFSEALLISLKKNQLISGKEKK